MTLNRRIGLGFQLAVSPSNNGSWTTVGSIVDGFKGADAKADVADTSVLSDNWKVFSKSAIDPGEVTFSVAYDPDSTDVVDLMTLIGSVSTTAPGWKVTFPLGSAGSGVLQNETFTGFVVGFTRTVEKAKLVVADITIKVTGDPNFGGVS